MKNVQNTTCDGDFAPLRSQNRCVIKFRPIYMAQFNTRQHLRLEMGQNLNFKVLAIFILMAPATSHSFSELNRLLGNWG